jgi:hypothetical protein
MTRLLSRSLLAASLAAPLALAAAPVRAQDAPPPADLQPVPTAPPAAPQPVQVQPQPTSPQPQYPVPPTYPAPPPYYPAPGPTMVPYQQPQQQAWQRPEHEYVPPGNWYGWQSLIAVAPFDIAMFAGLAKYGQTAGTGAFAAGFIGRNLAPAAVHLAHGRGTAAFGSVGLHLAATATGVTIGYAIGIAVSTECKPLDPCRNGFHDIPAGPVYGAIAGSMVGTVLDVVFLAHRKPLSWTAARAEPTWTMAPFATPKTAGLAAGGTF